MIGCDAYDIEIKAPTTRRDDDPTHREANQDLLFIAVPEQQPRSSDALARESENG
jgi:hypothetical protein